MQSFSIVLSSFHDPCKIPGYFVNYRGGLRWRQTEEYHLGLPTILTLELSVGGEFCNPVACLALVLPQIWVSSSILGRERVWVPLNKLPKSWQWGSRPPKLCVPHSSAKHAWYIIVQLPLCYWGPHLLSGSTCLCLQCVFLLPTLCPSICIFFRTATHTFVLVDNDRGEIIFLRTDGM